jgi:peptidoglycan/xylan/chitin deacetylase (PgdA/CDA1 family)
MKHIKVDLSIIGPILILSIIPIGLYSTFLPAAVFSQSDDDTRENDEDEDNDITGNSRSSGGNSKFVILTFGDGYKSQYTTAKPILDEYGYKGTFYVVCNYAQKEDTDRMNWNDIQELQKQGHNIGSHSMNHADLTDIPAYRIDYEVGISKQCLLSHGINVTSFAYPFAKGSQNESIVSTVSKYYTLGRTANAPLMFLDCSGWDNSNDDMEDDTSLTLVSSSSDENDKNESCSMYSEVGNHLNAVNRYSIMGWTHDSERLAKHFDDSQMFQRFIEVVDGQDKYNDESDINAIPIIIWHNIEDTTTDVHTTTSTKLFEAEIKYLHDNGFTVLTMDDLVYDEHNNSLQIREGGINIEDFTSIVSRIDHTEDVEDGNEDNT